MPPDPATQQILDLIAQLGGPPITQRTPEEAREDYARLTSMSAGTLPDVSSIERREIAGVPVHVVTPHGEAPLPVLTWFHGGGWVIGSSELSLPVCAQLATQAGCIVVSVDYSLAPEAPFPQAVEECISVGEWLLEHAAELGGDPRRVAVGGDSAGGNLAAVVAQEVDGFVFQLLVYPVVDATASHPSYVENASGYLLEADTMRWFIDHYLHGADPRDPRVSPLYAQLDTFADLPPALVITAELDPLRDEGQAYAERMRQAGVEVMHTCYEGQIHGFFSMGELLPAGSRAVSEAANALRSAFAA